MATPDDAHSREATAYLHRHIPLSAAMAVEVQELNDRRIRLFVPLKPNLNHRETAFGGSLSAAAILASWTVIHSRLDAEGISCRLVIQRSETDYRKPVETDFVVTAELPDKDTWSRFVETLRRRGKSRLDLTAFAGDGADPSVVHQGRFVAITSE